MIIYPPAKINLGLYVFSGRKDGYHDIESVFYRVDEANSNLKCDVLEIAELSDGRPAGSGGVVMEEAGIEYPGSPAQNICVKAYSLLAQDFKLPPVRIALQKNIPVGAGLGGGSSDGACVLLALNRMFGLGLSTLDLVGYAARLGSDCPFFVYAAEDAVAKAAAAAADSGKVAETRVGVAVSIATESVDTEAATSGFAMLATGRGEILSPIDIPALLSSSPAGRYKIKIIFPKVHISTAQAYSIVRSRVKDKNYIPLADVMQMPLQSWPDKLVNDFEVPIFAQNPTLLHAKEGLALSGADYVSMTGSGSAVYGIFTEK